MPIKKTALLLLTLLAALPAEAGLRDRCRRMCRPEVARCRAAGYTRASCRQALIAQCRKSGGACTFDSLILLAKQTTPPIETAAAVERVDLSRS